MNLKNIVYGVVISSIIASGCSMYNKVGQESTENITQQKNNKKEKVKPIDHFTFKGYIHNEKKESIAVRAKYTSKSYIISYGNKQERITFKAYEPNLYEYPDEIKVINLNKPITYTIEKDENGNYINTEEDLKPILYMFETQYKNMIGQIISKNSKPVLDNFIAADSTYLKIKQEYELSKKQN